MTGIRVAHLSYHYGSKTALDDVNFAVEQGKFCALLGPNGAGKSTLVDLLPRFMDTTEGEIFVDGVPIQNRWRTLADLPAVTPLAEKISKDLKRRGFRFVGPTIVYAHMQATGMVNDHLTSCYRWREINERYGG